MSVFPQMIFMTIVFQEFVFYVNWGNWLESLIVSLVHLAHSWIKMPTETRNVISVNQAPMHLMKVWGTVNHVMEATMQQKMARVSVYNVCPGHTNLAWERHSVTKATLEDFHQTLAACLSRCAQWVDTVDGELQFVWIVIMAIIVLVERTGSYAPCSGVW